MLYQRNEVRPRPLEKKKQNDLAVEPRGSDRSLAHDATAEPPAVSPSRPHHCSPTRAERSQTQKEKAGRRRALGNFKEKRIVIRSTADCSKYSACYLPNISEN